MANKVEMKKSGSDGPGPRKRTNTGCVTCRIRRVKCDETKPGCQKCAKSKRVCDGYLPATTSERRANPRDSDTWEGGTRDATTATNNKPLSRRALAVVIRQVSAVGPAARVLAPSAYLEDDVACFDYFRLRQTAMSSDPRESARGLRGFWNFTLLQAAHLEPAVWHAVAALGALHRRWEVVSGSPPADGTPSAPPPSTRLAGQAAACYTASMTQASTIRDPRTMLVLSLALAAAANLSGRWRDSTVHARAGQRILSQLRRCHRPAADVEVHAAEVLARLGLQWLTFSERTAVAPAPDDVDFAAAPPVTGFDGGLLGIHRANVGLVAILSRILAAAATDGGFRLPDDDEDLGQQQQQQQQQQQRGGCSTPAEEAVRRDLAAWEDGVIGLVEGGDPRALRGSLDLLSIKMLHAAARLLLEAGTMRPDYSEMGWDRHLARFERIVALAVLVLRKEALRNPLMHSVMSLDEPSINIVLWLTAHRCRHPVLRRRAVALLRGARRLEGVWMSTSAALAAGKLIELEEGPEGAAAWAGTVSTREWAGREQRLVAQIEAEDDAGPRSWLGGRRGVWRPAVSAEEEVGWDQMLGQVVVPPERRVLETDVLVEYDPQVGRSRGELVLLLADRDESGGLRKETVVVYF